jgi:hypothetical protein
MLERWRRGGWTAGLAAVVLGGAVLGWAPGGSVASAEPVPGKEEGATCGRPGQARCPMQAWMRTRLAEPLSQGKMITVAEALDRLAAAPPEKSWALWAMSSRDGAAAARRGDGRALRQSCRTCHDAYRAPFRKKHRLDPAPP